MSGSEVIICRSMREIFAAIPIGQAIVAGCASLKDVEMGLSWLLPEVLGEVYPTWNGMALDSVRAFAAKRNGESEIELFGACELLSNFRWMLLHARIQIAAEADSIVWVEFRVAEKMPDGIPKTYRKCEVPWRKSARMETYLDRLDWMYKVSYGEKRS